MSTMTRQLAAVREDKERLQRDLPLLKEQEKELSERKTVLRAQRDRKARDLSRQRAELSLLLGPILQRELDRVGNPVGGIEAIASLAGMDPQAIWDLLSGEARPDTDTWQRIYRLLAVCQSQLGLEAVTAARRICDEMVQLHTELNNINKRVDQCVQQWNQARRNVVRTHAELEHLSVRADAIAEMDTVKDNVPDLPYAPPGFPDLEGNDYRPDPLQATSPAEFVATMRAYQQWAGNPSFREMERRCGKRVSYSTFRNLLTRETVPAKLYQVHTFVQVLGGTTDDLQRWATAWRRFTMQQPTRISHEPDAETTGGRILRMTGT